MELCSGGSLFTLLENPANAYGFLEDDFKQVVKDVGKHHSVTNLFYNTYLQTSATVNSHYSRHPRGII